MDLRTIGVILIGVVLLVIVLAFVFSSKFRKDVIASEGEAAILGLINVKGVIIVLLTAIFGGILVYLIQLETDVQINGQEPERNLAMAVDILQSTDDDHYTLEYRDSLIIILLGNKEIGSAPLKQDRFATRRRNADDDYWDVYSGADKRLGFFELSKNIGFLKFNAVKADPNQNSVDHSSQYGGDDGDRSMMFGVGYQLSNSSLVFRVDSVQVFGGSKYWFSFGEGSTDRERSIKWSEYSYKFEYSSGARIVEERQFKFLSDPSWKKLYFVGIGIGNPSHSGDHIFNRVDLVNVVVMEAVFK